MENSEILEISEESLKKLSRIIEQGDFLTIKNSSKVRKMVEHFKCIVLEKRGFIVRKYENDSCILWSSLSSKKREKKENTNIESGIYKLSNGFEIDLDRIIYVTELTMDSNQIMASFGVKIESSDLIFVNWERNNFKTFEKFMRVSNQQHINLINAWKRRKEALLKK